MSRASSRPDFGYVDAERRRDPRKTVSISAEITIGDAVQCDCTIINISQGGALLAIPAGFVLPDQFMLTPPSRVCRVAWRNEDRVGVSFQADESFMDM
jgi:hypothetical protein